MSATEEKKEERECEERADTSISGGFCEDDQRERQSSQNGVRRVGMGIKVESAAMCLVIFPPALPSV